MFDPKPHGRALRAKKNYVSTAKARVCLLILSLAAGSTFIAFASDPAAAEQHAQADDAAGARFFCMLGLHGEWKRCAMLSRHGGRHD